MSKRKLPKNLVYRTGVVRNAGLGYLLAGDPKKEDDEIAHTVTIRWSAGTTNQGVAQFTANSCCLVEQPEGGLLKTSGPGIYSYETRNGVTAGNIFDEAQPPPGESRFGDFASVTEIGGQAYAVGYGGMVYRMEGARRWIQIDSRLPESFDIEAIDGFSSKQLYAIGTQGQLWQFNGRKWLHIELPTNVNLNAVKCAGDGQVYIAGQGGILIRGLDRQWDLIEHEATTDNIWDLEWFSETLYVSTMSHVYALRADSLIEENMSDGEKLTCFHLTAAPDVMWSVGAADVMAFDGKQWSRIL